MEIAPRKREEPLGQFESLAFVSVVGFVPSGKTPANKALQDDNQSSLTKKEIGNILSDQSKLIITV